MASPLSLNGFTSRFASVVFNQGNLLVCELYSSVIDTCLVIALTMSGLPSFVEFLGNYLGGKKGQFLNRH